MDLGMNSNTARAETLGSSWVPILWPVLFLEMPAIVSG
jgi:hypothetical protein